MCFSDFWPLSPITTVCELNHTIIFEYQVKIDNNLAPYSHRSHMKISWYLNQTGPQSERGAQEVLFLLIPGTAKIQIPLKCVGKKYNIILDHLVCAYSCKTLISKLKWTRIYCAPHFRSAMTIFGTGFLQLLEMMYKLLNSHKFRLSRLSVSGH